MRLLTGLAGGILGMTGGLLVAFLVITFATEEETKQAKAQPAETVQTIRVDINPGVDAG